MPSVFTVWFLPATKALPPYPFGRYFSLCILCLYFFVLHLSKIIVVNNLWKLSYHSNLCQLDICLFTNFVIHFVFNSLPTVANFFPTLSFFSNIGQIFPFIFYFSLLSMYLNLWLNGIRFTIGTFLPFYISTFWSISTSYLHLFPCPFLFCFCFLKFPFFSYN